MRFFVPLLPFVYAGEVDEASGAVVLIGRGWGGGKREKGGKADRGGGIVEGICERTKLLSLLRNVHTYTTIETKTSRESNTIYSRTKLHYAVETLLNFISRSVL